jgi:hypothetical protein
MSSKGFTRMTFAWLRLLKGDRDLTALAVGVQLIEHFNEKEGGQARVGCQYIARELGLTPSTVVRALHRLADRGRLRIEWGSQGRGHVNHCWMVIGENGEKRCASASFSSAEKVRQSSPEKVRQTSRKGAPAHMNLLKNHRSEGKAKAFPLAGRKSEPSVLDAPGSVRAPLAGAAEPLEEPEGYLEAEPGGTSPSNGDDGDGRLHAAWRALVKLWAVRPWPITPREVAIAHMLFVQTVAAGTPVDAVLAGAGAWVSGIDEPRFLMALPQWLQAKAWERPPPAKRRRQAPQAHGQRHGYQRREKTDLASLMHQLGQTM